MFESFECTESLIFRGKLFCVLIARWLKDFWPTVLEICMQYGTYLVVGAILQWCLWNWNSNSNPDLDSSPDLSPFLLELDLKRKDIDLDSDLGRFVTKSTFNFHCAHLQFCLGRMTFCHQSFWSVSFVSVLYWLWLAVWHVLHQWIMDGVQSFTLYWIFYYWYIPVMLIRTGHARTRTKPTRTRLARTRTWLTRTRTSFTVTYCKLQLNLQSLSSNNNEHKVKVHNIWL